MKKIKNILIILIVTVVILIAGIFIMLKRKSGPGITDTKEAIEIMEKETSNKKAEKLVNAEEYIEIRTCINSYLSEININNSSFYGYDASGNYVNLMREEDINKNMYGVLSKEYIDKKSININNIRNYVYKIEEDCFFVPIELMSFGNIENVKTFGVYGVIITQEYRPVMESYMVVNIDEHNNTFSIEQLSNKEELNNYIANVPNEILEENNNVYSGVRITSEDLIQGYINDYKRLSLAYPELLYNNFLDEDYKNKRFGSLDEYKKYISNNRNIINSINPASYQVTEQLDYTRYVVMDDNGKYYIFNSETPSSYKILLDTYTIDLPEFIEKYEGATDQQKVALNIEKFIQSINAKDYKYAYGCLADSFKNNYFKTQAEFENYAKQNFFDNNTVGYKEFSIQGDVYSYSVVLTNKATGEQKNKTFIMQLGEETDFVMSFDR